MFAWHTSLVQKVGAMTYIFHLVWFITFIHDCDKYSLWHNWLTHKVGKTIIILYL